MTTLAQTALEFCRECLEWRDPAQLNPTSFYDAGRDMLDGALFHPADLNVVVEAVRGWCDRHEGGIELCYYGYLPGEWEASVSTSVSVEQVTHSDLSHALMAACVEASRKMKA